MNTLADMPQKRKRAMRSDEFRRLMESAGMSQGETAKELGVSLRSVNRWAAGGTISPTVAVAILAKLGKKNG